MLTVNVTNIRDHSKELKTLMDKYEVATRNILRELTNLDTGWHDENSGDFFALVETQKNEISKLKMSIDDICNRYDTIESETIAIDGSINKVFCDQTYQGKIKNKYDVSIGKINGLLDRLDSFIFAILAFSYLVSLF